MGFFSNLDTESYDRAYSDRELVQRLWIYFRPYRRRLASIAFLLITLAMASAGLPLFVSYGVDLIAELPTEMDIFWLSSAVLAVGLYNWGANWIRRRLTVRLIGDVIYAIRTDAFKAAASHDLAFYDRFSSGKIVSRISSDTREFGQLVTLVTDIISQIIQAVILAVVLLTISWQLSLVIIGFLPITFIVSRAFRNLARKVTRRGMRAMANVNATIKETISGISVAKNFRQEAAIFEEFNHANIASYKVNVRRGLVLSLVFPSLNVLGGIATAVLVYFGGLNVVSGVITVGAWYLFLMSLDRFFFPVLNLSAFSAQVQSGLSAAERAFGLIDAESSVVQIDQQNVTRLSGDIQFVNLFFRYTEQEPIFENFSVHVHSGESVALVGHSGAGKSSIAKLIARFYEFQEGHIFVDNQDIRSLDLRQYRNQLGIVSQIPFLFSGTVAENICYSCADTSAEEVRAISMQIGEGEWLRTLPNGLATQVGERGSQLSMGQRQLVALLRVLLHRPAIFILDEATASVDPFTEWQIQQALKLILVNSTSILIAHRLSTIRAADRILVLDKGRVIEEGNHEGLMLGSGHYANLYNTYFRHQSLDYVEQSRGLASQG